MSAADKLRALEKRMAIQRGETLYAGHPALEAEKVVRNALPELIGVVDAAENGVVRFPSVDEPEWENPLYTALAALDAALPERGA